MTKRTTCVFGLCPERVGSRIDSVTWHYKRQNDMRIDECSGRDKLNMTSAQDADLLESEVSACMTYESRHVTSWRENDDESHVVSSRYNSYLRHAVAEG